MDNNLIRIKNAIVRGDAISNRDYYDVLKASESNTEDGRYAHSILRTYNYRTEQGKYNSYTDPMRAVTCRREDKERDYGRLGMDIFG